MNKYSLHLMLWQHDANERGEMPIYIKITIDRKTSYIATGYYILPKFWDAKNELVKNTYTLHQHINPDITNKKTLVSQKIVELQIAGKTVSAKEIKAHFATGRNIHNFFDFAEAYTQEIAKERSQGTLSNYKKHLLKLELYHGSKNLLLGDITPQYLIDYENAMRSGEGAIGGNYVHTLMSTLRMFLTAAVKKQLLKASPFAQYSLPAYVEPDKDFLTLKELAEWEKFADTTANPVLKETAIYFLLGCYAGFRVGDWYNFDINKHIEDDRILLRPEKTTRKNKWVNMVVSNALKRNLIRMAAVPLTLREATINEKVKEIAKKLGIRKHITTHTGRHTFAVTVCLNQKISSETAAKLMGITLDTFVNNYSQVTQSKIDKETQEAWEHL